MKLFLLILATFCALTTNAQKRMPYSPIVVGQKALFSVKKNGSLYMDGDWFTQISINTGILNVKNYAVEGTRDFYYFEYPSSTHGYTSSDCAFSGNLAKIDSANGFVNYSGTAGLWPAPCAAAFIEGIVRPSARLGDTMVFFYDARNQGCLWEPRKLWIYGIVEQIEVRSILGRQDSVKVIRLNRHPSASLDYTHFNNKQLEISRNHGWITAPNIYNMTRDSLLRHLIGLPDSGLGAVLPKADMKKRFCFQPGDVYSIKSSYCNRPSWGVHDTYTTRTITGVSWNTDSTKITLLYSDIKRTCDDYPVNGTGTSGCSSYWNAGSAQQTFNVPPAPPNGLPWQSGVIVKQVGGRWLFPKDSILYPVWGNNSYQIQGSGFTSYSVSVLQNQCLGIVLEAKPLHPNLEVLYISPNPARSTIRIGLPKSVALGLAYRIRNAAGQIVRNAYLTEANPVLNITDFPNGIYQIEARQDRKSAPLRGRFVKD